MKSCEELIADGKKAEEKISEWETKYDEAQKTIDGLKEDIVRLEKVRLHFLAGANLLLKAAA